MASPPPPCNDGAQPLVPKTVDSTDERLREGAVACMIERSVFTLRRARCDRPDLRVPPHEVVGGKVYYRAEVVREFVVTRSLIGRRP